MATETEKKMVKKIRQAIKRDRLKLDFSRSVRRGLIKNYVGQHWSEEGHEDKVPLPFLALAILIYNRQLFGANPQLMVSPRPGSESLNVEGQHLEIALNNVISRIGLESVFQRAGLDAMFTEGYVKTGVGFSGHVQIDEEYHMRTESFSDSVEHDNIVYDMTPGKRWDTTSYIGDRFQICRDFVLESDLYDLSDDDRESLKDTDGRKNMAGDKRVEDMQAPNRTFDGEDFEVNTECWEVYLRRINEVWTLPAEDPSEESLWRKVEWKGPEWGPYTRLHFMDVPGNLRALSPSMLWSDLHTLSNELFAKLGRQALDQKQVGIVDPAMADSGAKIIKIGDRDWIVGRGTAQLLDFNGPHSGNLALVMQLREYFSWFAGNLDILGGLGAASGTVGQDKLMEMTSSKQLAQMQSQGTKFADRVCKTHAHFILEDPLFEEDIEQRIENTKIVLKNTVSKRSLKGDWSYENFNLDIYSMQGLTPSEKFQRLNMFMQQILMPLLPYAAQEGLQIKVEPFLRKAAKLLNISADVNEIIQFVGVNPMADAALEGGTPGVGKPSQTTRKYVREGRPGPTMSGNERNLMQLLTGGGVQDGQLNQLMKGAA